MAPGRERCRVDPGHGRGDKIEDAFARASMLGEHPHDARFEGSARALHPSNCHEPGDVFHGNVATCRMAAGKAIEGAGLG